MRFRIWIGSVRALMTLPSAERDWLIAIASCSVSPTEPLLDCRSEPARSTRLIRELRRFLYLAERPREQCEGQREVPRLATALHHAASQPGAARFAVGRTRETRAAMGFAATYRFSGGSGGKRPAAP